MATITTIASSDTLSASRSTINTNFSTLQNTFKGSTAPTSPVAGQFWIEDDNPSSTVWTLWVYDGTDWIEMGRIDSTNNRMQIASGAYATGAINMNSSKINALASGTATTDRKSTRLNSSHVSESRMPSSA